MDFGQHIDSRLQRRIFANQVPGAANGAANQCETRRVLEGIADDPLLAGLNREIENLDNVCKNIEKIDKGRIFVLERRISEFLEKKSTRLVGKSKYRGNIQQWNGEDSVVNEPLEHDGDGVR